MPELPDLVSPNPPSSGRATDGATASTADSTVDTHTTLTTRTRWLRPVWLLAGWLALLLGFIGIFLPLLPTTPFVLLAAWCFSKGSQRWERWLLQHPKLGPLVHDWRATRAVPLRAKQLATVMMSVSCVWAWFHIASWWRLAPAISCTLVALWLWRLPTRVPRGR